MQKTTVIPISIAGFVNVFLLRGERTVLVDTATPGHGKTILDAAAKQGVRPEDISLIFLTHAHNDHIGSALDLRERLGVPVAVPAAEADAVRQNGFVPPPAPIGLTGRILLGLMKIMPAHRSPFEPDIVHRGDLDLGEYGVPAEILPTPGHSPSHVALRLPSGEIIAGDALAGKVFSPHTPSLPYFAESLSLVRESIAKIAARAEGTVYVGHGGPLTPDAVRRFAAQETGK